MLDASSAAPPMCPTCQQPIVTLPQMSIQVPGDYKPPSVDFWQNDSWGFCRNYSLNPASSVRPGDVFSTRLSLGPGELLRLPSTTASLNQTLSLQLQERRRNPYVEGARLLSTVSVSSDCGVCGTDSFRVQTNTTPTFTVGRESGCVLEDMIAQRDAGSCSSCMVNRARGDWYYNAPRDTWVCHDDLDGTVPSAGKSCTSLLTLPAVLPITIGRHTLPWPSMNFAAVDFPVVGLDLAPLLAFEPVSVHDFIYIELSQPQHSF